MATTSEDGDPPLTETSPVQCLFITGASIEVTRHTMRFVGWVVLPDLGDLTIERRIAVRLAMPIDAARALRKDLEERLHR